MCRTLKKTEKEEATHEKIERAVKRESLRERRQSRERAVRGEEK